jgi:hypothetical protein
MDPETAFIFNPTIETATCYLKHEKIHVPFERLLARSHTASVQTFNKSSALKRSRSQHGGANTELIHNLSRLDFLHDIYNPLYIPRNVVDKTLAHTSLSDDQKQHVRDIMKVKNGVTRKLASVLVRHMPGKCIYYNTHHAISQDIELYKWTRNKIETNLDVTIVLDGIYSSFDSNKDVNDYTRSLVIYAFTMVLMGNLYEAGISFYIKTGNQHKIAKVKSMPKHCNSITFLTGAFQTIDISGYDAFLHIWIDRLNDIINWSDVVTMKRVDVSPINQRFQFSKDFRYALLDSSFRVGNKPLTSGNGNSNIETLQHISKHLTFNYKKQDLRSIVNLFENLNETEWDTWKHVLYQLIDINFFRDAYRAEVAIQTNSIFITIDRLSYLYYDIQATQKQALCILPGKNEITTIYAQ